MKNKQLLILSIGIIILLAVSFYLIIPKEETSEKSFCKSEQRNIDSCIEIHQPVCGWNNPEKIQCIKYPCANTYSNSCFACKDENVLYYTDGECPTV